MSYNMNSRVKLAIGFLIGLVVPLIPMNSQLVMTQAQVSLWSTPVNISHSPAVSWFPDIAVDNENNVHVVWCETAPLTEGPTGERVHYSMWDGRTWSEPIDIVQPSQDIIRNAIAADQMGNLHLLFGGSPIGVGHLSQFHKKVPARDVWLAARWSAPHRISQGGSYMGDIAVDSKGVLHVIYDDTLRTGENIYSDIFYRRSTDGGQTWSYPINLFHSPATGSSHSQMEIDGNDTIHVVWDEGWDRLSGDGNFLYSCYTFSSDGGETWAPVIHLTYPQSPIQITVGSDGRGGVMLVWRTTSRSEFFYQWSADGGRSWAPPQIIPMIFARPSNQGLSFDMYDMAADSAGYIHLVVVGRESPLEGAPLGVYHLTWDGRDWSMPERIYSDAELYPEYTKIVISRGNQLHVVWFTRDMLWDTEGQGNYEVWYSSSQSLAPPQTPVSLTMLTPTLTATPVATTVAPLPSPIPTATPYPILESETTGLPDGLYTDSDDIMRLIVGLSPVAFLILLVAAFKLIRSRK
ncbi:MAG: exo-alpha-sialidase [Anaerolineae bacterium]